MGLLDRVADAVAKRLTTGEALAPPAPDAGPCPRCGAPASRRIESSMAATRPDVCGVCAYQFPEAS